MSTTDLSVRLPARTRADHASAVPWLPVVGLAAVKVAVSMVFAGRYGWHRDELYYLASARHPALGYVDYPPVAPMVARLVQVVAPDSVVALKFASVLAGALVVVLAALIARELGGGRAAQVLAAIAVVISPEFLGGNFIFETVSFDQLAWALLLWLVARVLAGHDERLWLLAGVVLGIGLETKYTIAALAVALAAGLLPTPARRHLATRWPWLGAGLALLLLAPNLWWQAGHGWDSVAYVFSHRDHTDGPVAYWAQQALFLVNPLLLPLAVAGAVWLWRSGTFRALAWTAIVVELVLFAAGGKSYYPAALYPLLYAAGAVWLERSVGSRLLRRAWAAAATAVTLLLVPILLPVLPADVIARSPSLQTSVSQQMFGWPDLAREVAAADAGLPPSDRREAMVLAAHDSEAGAIDLYGPALGLPAVVSPHLTYYYWAPARMDPQVVIAVGYQRADLEALFVDVSQVGTISNAYGIANNDAGTPIFVCRSPRQPLWRAWPSLKTLD